MGMERGWRREGVLCFTMMTEMRRYAEHASNLGFDLSLRVNDSVVCRASHALGSLELMCTGKEYTCCESTCDAYL